MKKICFTFSIVLFTARIAFGQWTTGTGGAIYYNGGYVGIGTTTPAAPLQVVGSMQWSDGFLGSGGQLELGPLTGAAATPYIDMHYGTGSFQDYNVRLINTANNVFSIYTSSVGPVFTVNGGSVGIGTTLPADALSVTNSSYNTLGLYRSVANGNLAYNAAAGRISFGVFNTSTTTNPEVYGPLIFARTTEAWLPTTNLGSDLEFWTIPNGSTTPAAGMRLDQNGGVAVGLYAALSAGTAPLDGIMVSGHVLIGQNTLASGLNPNYMLNVAGSARMNSIAVNTTGADFVFAPKYKLMPLSDLGRYVSQNHHLPGIEPAKKMQADGLDLGENETKLLQKVEELTLYLVQKDKQLAAEQEKVNEQEMRLKKLEAEVQELIKAKN